MIIIRTMKIGNNSRTSHIYKKTIAVLKLSVNPKILLIVKVITIRVLITERLIIGTTEVLIKIITTVI